ncbi:MAG TPA: hypothetical protein VK177_04785 [Flavobacteriales bacterium]|nr:hypothetical protein [Flavobacteriales bacterium]
MGFLSRLFGSKNDRAKRTGLQKTDRVYIDRKAANRAIIRHCVESGQLQRQLIIIYFFKETKAEFEVAVTNATNVSWVNAFFPAQIRQAGIGGWDNVDVIVAETYPDINTEQQLLDELTNAGYTKPTLTFYNGLDDPTLVLFGAERIQKLMRSLGLKDDEPVEHKMITKSMDRAQEKLSKKNFSIGRIDSRVEMVRRLTSV